jgi:hypothetical protein
MIVALSIIVVIMFMLMIDLRQSIKKMADQLELLDREQHTQNKDILELLKYRNDSSTLLLQQREVLEYLAERDPLLTKVKMPISTIIGEA